MPTPVCSTEAVSTQPKRVIKRDLARFRSASVVRVTDAMKRLGYVNYVIGGMRPFTRGAKETSFAGSALTLRFAPVSRPEEHPERPVSHYEVVATAGPSNVLEVQRWRLAVCLLGG